MNFVQFLEIEYVESSEEGAVGKLPLKEIYFNGGGSVHGGIIMTLTDTMAGKVAYGTGSKVTTLEGHTHFLSACRGGEYLLAEATLIKRGRSIITIDVEAKDDRGTVIAISRYSFFVKEN